MRINLLEAQRLLEKGHVVAIPTETVYGLGGLLKYPQTIEQIFTLKGRPSNNPLIIHVASIQELTQYVSHLPIEVEALANTFWPGPMTLVLPILPDKIPDKARAGLPTAAFRIPQHPVALQLLSKIGALVMPSANISGMPSATSPKHVEADFGRDFPVLEGGPCRKGLESTILLFRKEQWEIIRLGAIEPEAFNRVLGYVPIVTSHENGESPLCPGQMYRHYAPAAQLILLDALPLGLEGIVLGFQHVSYPVGCRILEMGSLDSPESVAENLYTILRRLDEWGVEQAYVDMNFPREGLWLTIAERLTKASLY
jgi:L-threonylcarbamoyladenylate synthase